MTDSISSRIRNTLFNIQNNLQAHWKAITFSIIAIGGLSFILKQNLFLSLIPFVSTSLSLLKTILCIGSVIAFFCWGIKPLFQLGGLFLSLCYQAFKLPYYIMGGICTYLIESPEELTLKDLHKVSKLILSDSNLKEFLQANVGIIFDEHNNIRIDNRPSITSTSTSCLENLASIWHNPNFKIIGNPTDLYFLQLQEITTILSKYRFPSSGYAYDPPKVPPIYLYGDYPLLGPPLS